MSSIYIALHLLNTQSTVMVNWFEETQDSIRKLIVCAWCSVSMYQYIRANTLATNSYPGSEVEQSSGHMSWCDGGIWGPANNLLHTKCVPTSISHSELELAQA